MRKRLALLTLVLLLIGGAVGGTVAWADLGANRNEIPKGVLSVAELLENPVYDTEVTIQGEVTLLGELFCPCFVLVSGGETIQVWYGLMVEDDGTQRPPVSVEGIENGDWVIVTGELRPSEGQLPSRTLWASDIEKLDVHPTTIMPTPTPPWPHTELPKGPMTEVLAPIDDIGIKERY